MASTQWMTLDETLEELGGISRSTFAQWRADGRGPHGKRLPNGRVLFSRSEIEEWVESMVTV